MSPELTCPPIDEIRSRFPALGQDHVFLENAGGSQIPDCVINAIDAYFRESYVQLGGEFEASKLAGKIVDRAHEFVNQFVGGAGAGQVILGPSTTQLITMLAHAYGKSIADGDEIVLCETAHEANAGPWLELQRFGAKIVLWRVDPLSFQCSLYELESLLSTRTRLVAFPHVSNLLGEVVDVEAITRLCHSYGAKVVVDGVAYAPHGPIDVKQWGVDWYAYSTYKVYGPHMAALWGRDDALATIEGPNHFFIANDHLPYKFELGGPCHEGCAGIAALEEYLRFVGNSVPESDARTTVVTSMNRMRQMERPLIEEVLAFLNGRSDCRIVGPDTGENRVGTFSFVHDRLSSLDIARKLAAKNIGVKSGHMYAYRLVEALGLDANDGVLRVSLVHYNTMEEIGRLLGELEEIFDKA